MADSYHLYGSNIAEFKDRFVKNLQTRSFEERTARYEDWKEIMAEARPRILKKVEEIGK